MDHHLPSLTAINKSGETTFGLRPSADVEIGQGQFFKLLLHKIEIVTS
jgi:hypothetical protein